MNTTEDTGEELCAVRASTPHVSATSRVLLRADLYGPGGTESHLMNLCELLSHSGAHLTLATRVARPSVPLLARLQEFGIRHVTTPFASQPKQLNASQIWSYVAWPVQLRRDYDVLYTYSIGRSTAFLRRYVRPGGKVIWHPMGNPDALPDIASKIPPSFVDVAVAESSIHARILHEVVPSRVHISTLPALAHVRSAPRKPRDTGGVLRVAFLGRFDDNKGALWLTEIWPQLNLGAARLDYYGDGPLRDELKRKIELMDRGDIAVHGGWTRSDELGAILSATDLVVLPSASEGVPLVLLESMAHGVPFVASNVGGIPALTEENPDVSVAPVGPELANAMRTMVAAIRDGRVDGRRLQRYYQQRYSPDVTAQRWLSLFGSHN